MDRDTIRQVLDTVFVLWEHRLWYGIDDRMRSTMIQEIMGMIDEQELKQANDNKSAPTRDPTVV